MPLVRIKKIKRPELKISKSLENKIEALCRTAIMNNIKEQKTIDGGMIKRNKKSTAQRKIDNNWTYRGSVLSLVAEEHRFVKKEYWEGEWDSTSLTIRPRDELIEINKYVQDKEYTGWFGLQKRDLDAVIQFVADFLKEKIRKANG